MENAKDKGYKGAASKSLLALNQISDGIKKSTQDSKAALKFMETSNKLNEMSFQASDAEASKLQEALMAVGEKLAAPNQSDQQVANRLAELEILQEQANEISERFENALNSDESVNALKIISSKLNEQTSTIEDGIRNDKTEDRIKDLEGFFGSASNESTLALKEAYQVASKNLEDAINQGDMEAKILAQKQLDAVESGVESEEKRREAQKAAEEANSKLGAIASGMENLGKSFDDIAKGVLAGGGVFAGIAGLVLAFVNPEKFAEIFGTVLNSLKDTFQGIVAIFEGDFDKGLSILGDNIGTVAALVGGIGLYFGGAIIGAIGGLFAKIKTLVTAFKAFRLFMIGTFIPGMVTALGTMMSSLTAVLAPFLPIIAIAAAIGLVVYGIYKGLEALKESLGFTSILDVLQLGFAYLQDGLAIVANTLIDIVNGITGFIAEKGQALLDFLGIDFELPSMQIDKLSTNNAEETRAKLDEKARIAAEEEANNPPVQLDPVEKPKEFSIDQVAQPQPLTTGAELDFGSMVNSAAKENTSVAAPIIAASASNNNSTNSVNNTTIINSNPSEAMSYLRSKFAR